MISNGLILLPILAMALVIQGDWLGADDAAKLRSRKSQKRYMTKVWMHRSLILSLCLGTLIAHVVSVPAIPALIVGLALTAVFMLPYIIYKLFFKPQSRRSRQADPNAARPSNRSSNQPVKSKIAKNASAQAANNVNTEIPAATVTNITDSSATKQPQQPQQPQHDNQNNEAVAHQSARIAHVEQAEPHSKSIADLPEAPDSSSVESILDHTINVDEGLTVATQMENLDDAIEHHDLGEDSNEPASAATSLDNAISLAQGAMQGNAMSRETDINTLPAKSNQELTAMVASLQSDKMKLQKLVIAQKAVIESEKQSHDQTRVMADDAVIIMRRAREGQRTAQKIARRERAERTRLEQDNAKLKKQLQNAMSTLPSRDVTN